MADKNVTVYSTQTCPYCKMVKEFLKENGVAFKEVDVAADPKEAEALVARTGQMGVPQIDIDGDVVVGFDKDKLKKKLGL
ncbi:MAG: glutaredoxin family protein [Candidatus Omnitrophica bacterium]|nr:glutaredoxin family protein [Candidatus Omnitrophota bacterium]